MLSGSRGRMRHTAASRYRYSDPSHLCDSLQDVWCFGCVLRGMQGVHADALQATVVLSLGHEQDQLDNLDAAFLA